MRSESDQSSKTCRINYRYNNNSSILKIIIIVMYLKPVANRLIPLHSEKFELCFNKAFSAQYHEKVNASRFMSSEHKPKKFNHVHQLMNLIYVHQLTNLTYTHQLTNLIYFHQLLNLILYSSTHETDFMFINS
jgi:hypothetical protein